MSPPLAPWEALDLALRAARHVLVDSLPTTERFQNDAIDNAQHDTLTTRRGELHLALALREILREGLPSAVRQPYLEEIAKASEAAIVGHDTEVPVLGVIGGLASSGGYLKARGFLKERVGDLVCALQRSAVAFVYRVDLFATPFDRLNLLLLRLRAVTDEQTSRPVLMTDLRPFVLPALGNLKAPSKASSATCAFGAIADAHPDMQAFLLAVSNAEVLSDGAFPCTLPQLNPGAWETVLSTTTGRNAMAGFGHRVLKTFVSDVILNRLDREGSKDVQVYNALFEVAMSDRTLLNLLFRMGVYQEIPGCPFDGLDAPYPAVAIQV
ncbi:hypothetical protein C8R47DRAFT_1319308 [Mycena vitilis]|nr:hypothetical protein C8R47DRAFT_1319308 [Mycena vitilis]